MPKPTANGANGRDAKGKFVKGNTGGPGRPRASHHYWKELMLKQVSDEDFCKIIAKLVEKAKNGEDAAMRQLLEYFAGKPAQPIEGSIGVYAHEPTDEDVARAAEVFGRRLRYGRVTAAN